MARKTRSVRHLLSRQGRYYARVAVPERLRAVVGKRELLAPLGADRGDALARLPGAVAGFYSTLADAKRGVPPARPAVSIPHAAHDLYARELRLDDVARYAPALPPDPDFDTSGTVRPARFNELFADAYLHALRKVAGGIVSEDEIKEGFVEATIGSAIDDASEGKERPARGSKAYLDLAKALATARIESIERSRERDKGDFKGQPQVAMLRESPPSPELETAPVSIEGLLGTYLAGLARSGRGVEAGKRWAPVFRSLGAHLGHDDARKISKADLRAWLEKLRETLAEKTLRDVYLGAVKAVLTHAADHDLIASNPTVGVKIKLAKPVCSRERGFTTPEAAAVLRASRDYTPKPSDNPQTREGAELVAAKRWAPLLCAHSGARIAEVTQLRKEDIRADRRHPWRMRITPDAGSVKTRQYRDVPLHAQVIEEGFLAFVEAVISRAALLQGQPYPQRNNAPVESCLRAHLTMASSIEPSSRRCAA